MLGADGRAASLNEGGLKGGELAGTLKAKEIIRGFILTTWGSH